VEPVSGGAESEKPGLSESSSTAIAKPSSVDKPAADFQRDSSIGPPSTATQPLAPPPPPPPSTNSPADPASLSYFPALPPPPVERFPLVRLPPRHVHPDVRWRLHSATAPHLAAVPQRFHPPTAFPPNPQLIHPSYRFTSGAEQSHSSHFRTARHTDVSATGNSLPSYPSAVPETIPSVSAGKSSSTSTIREFEAKGATPRFVPRQLHTVHSASSSDDKVPRNPDPVIEDLKQKALVLSSKVQGPSLPSQIERKRKEFKSSDTGSESIDKTVRAVRQKVTQVSSDNKF